MSNQLESQAVAVPLEIEGEGAIPRVAAEGPAFDINVNWVVTENMGPWILTTPEFQAITGITRYKLYRNHDSGFQYHLVFTNIDTYDYSFTDQSPDTYGKDTYAFNNHTVGYNSNSPNIVHIHGQ